MDEYVSEILFWIGTCLSALAGTGITIGSVIKVIKNSVGLLHSGKKDYEESQKKLDSVADKILEGSETIDSVSKELLATQQKLEDVEKTNAEMREVLYLMAIGNPNLVANGIADKVTEILGKQDTSIKGIGADE